MNGHIDEPTLNEYLEGALDARQVERVDEHVAGCEQCRDRLGRQTGLLAELADLPREAEPARDLWARISRQIGSGAPTGADVIPISRGPARLRHRITLSLGQLLAAGVVLALLSGAGVWATLSRAPERGLAVGVPTAPETAVSVAALNDYEQAAFDLREVLTRGKELLDPATVQVLEENLETIEAAIAETREALARDPASEVLVQRLATNLRRRLEVLRHAASVVYAES